MTGVYGKMLKRHLTLPTCTMHTCWCQKKNSSFEGCRFRDHKLYSICHKMYLCSIICEPNITTNQMWMPMKGSWKLFDKNYFFWNMFSSMQRVSNFFLEKPESTTRKIANVANLWINIFKESLKIISQFHSYRLKVFQTESEYDSWRISLFWAMVAYSTQMNFVPIGEVLTLNTLSSSISNEHF